jgi:hypothetical protein
MTLSAVVVRRRRRAINDAVNQGSAIEFDAVLLSDVKELATVLPKLIAATEAGELDAHISAVMKVKQPVVAKRLVAQQASR